MKKLSVLLEFAVICSTYLLGYYVSRSVLNSLAAAAIVAFILRFLLRKDERELLVRGLAIFYLLIFATQFTSSAYVGIVIALTAYVIYKLAAKRKAKSISKT
jgi:predicted PurR-regulated permease PerM